MGLLFHSSLVCCLPSMCQTLWNRIWFLPEVLNNYILTLSPSPHKIKMNKLLSDGSKLYFKKVLNPLPKSQTVPDWVEERGQSSPPLNPSGRVTLSFLMFVSNWYTWSVIVSTSMTTLIPPRCFHLLPLVFLLHRKWPPPWTFRCTKSLPASGFLLYFAIYWKAPLSCSTSLTPYFLQVFAQMPSYPQVFLVTTSILCHTRLALFYVIALMSIWQITFLLAYLFICVSPVEWG